MSSSPGSGTPLRPATWTTSLTANGGAAPNVTRIRASGALAPWRSEPGSTVSRSTPRLVVNAAGSALSRLASGTGAAGTSRTTCDPPDPISSVAPAAITPKPLTVTRTWSPAPPIASSVANVSAAVVASRVTSSAVPAAMPWLASSVSVSAPASTAASTACTTVAPARTSTGWPDWNFAAPPAAVLTRASAPAVPPVVTVGSGRTTATGSGCTPCSAAGTAATVQSRTRPVTMRRSTVAPDVTATPSRAVRLASPVTPRRAPATAWLAATPPPGSSRATSIPLCTPTGSATSRTSDAGGRVPVSTRAK